MSFLEDSWEEREEKSYKEIFGDVGRGIFPLSAETFQRMNAENIDPTWLTYGVFKCPPNGERKTWAYVTSGMSNPWDSDKPEEYSGLGVEFMLETLEEENWAVDVLQTLTAYNLLLATGQMGDFDPLYYGHRVPLALSETVKVMMFVQPQKYPASFSIQSGKVELIQVVGITAPELDEAKRTSSDDLRDKILSASGSLVTKKDRDCVV